MTDGRMGRRGRAGRGWWVALALAAVAVVAVLVLPGVLTESLYDNRPSGVACGDLPERSRVEAALEAHAELVGRIEAVGDQVDVAVVAPCDSHPDRAEIRVFYPGGDDRERIEDVLDDDGFGVPISLVNA